jgi:ribosome-binding protein aMBF1 (putative translation factor)
MLKEAFYRRMIDANTLRAQFETIYGDVDLVVNVLQNCVKYGEKLKSIAKRKEDEDMANAAIESNTAMLSAIKGEISVAEFKKKMWELEERYPEYFQRGRRDIGTSKDNVKAIIHRIEYMIDRYDVRYPSYDRHRCNDA